jgi:tRNA-splicing ligase RtcB
MLHTGSRGVGNKIGSHFIDLAKQDMRRYFINLPDDNLAYLPEGTEFFDDYVEAVSWAQEFAMTSRNLMLDRAFSTFKRVTGLRDCSIDDAIINCHHNYVSKEKHYGESVYVTRKGAVSARRGQLGIIPGSMGAKSYIVSGRGNPESFMSCSHGAGRAMSREQARKSFTLEMHAQATEGVECRKDKDVIDETPMAYKPIDDVMNAQSDLVEIVNALKQVMCVKG